MTTETQEPDRIVLWSSFALDEIQARMHRQLMEELGMDSLHLMTFALTSLWVSVQLQKAAAMMK